MKVYDILDDAGCVRAFEVSNLFLSRRRTCDIINGISGVEVTRSLREAVFCSFTLDGQRFWAEEPWNDNSRYLIGPEGEERQPLISVVRSRFLDEKRFVFW